MGIYKAMSRRRVLGAPLPAPGELGVAAGWTGVSMGWGAFNLEDSEQALCGWLTNLSTQAGSTAYFVSIQSSNAHFYLFLSSTLLNICIPSKSWFILYTLCHTSDFSFNVSWYTISHFDGNLSSELISVIAVSCPIFCNSQTLPGKTSSCNVLDLSKTIHLSSYSIIILLKWL